MLVDRVNVFLQGQCSILTDLLKTDGVCAAASRRMYPLSKTASRGTSSECISGTQRNQVAFVDSARNR